MPVKNALVEPELLQKHQLDPQKIPAHIAIIMDGNGRWAKKRGLPRNLGHKKGADALDDAITNCTRFGIRYISAYVFSTENWKRPEIEVSFLMGFFRQVLAIKTKKMMKKGVKFRCLGNFDKLAPEIIEGIRETEAKTAQNTDIQVNLLFNYGSREEIVRACQSIVRENGDNPAAITEETVEAHLYTAGIPDPELLIRTGGNNVRLSNFMLWQLAYTELFFLETLWPDFDEQSMGRILYEFQQRERKFGGLISE